MKRTELNLTQASMLQVHGVPGVEDDHWDARNAAEALVKAETEKLGPVADARDGLQRIGAEGGRHHGALLEADVRNGPIRPVAGMRRAENGPIGLGILYDAGLVPAAYAHMLCVEQPGAIRTFIPMREGPLTSAVGR